MKRIADSAPQNAKLTSGFNPLTIRAMLLTETRQLQPHERVLLVLCWANFDPAALTSESR